LLSNEIASAFKVEHQSPQVILIYKEKVVYEASHSAIDSEMIKEIILKK
jgi:bacillithiol system protein YtxJ